MTRTSTSFGSVCARAAAHALGWLHFVCIAAGCAVPLEGSLPNGAEPSALAVAERAPAAVFRGAGLFVWHADAFRAADRASMVRDLGFSWIAIDVSDGSTVLDYNEAELRSGWADAWRAAGLTVGAWGVQRTDPEGEAAIAADAVTRWGFSFYIANAEAEYKYTAPDGSWDAEAFGRSARFVAAFRARHPHLPAAFSSYGRADLADIDYAAWRDAGFDWLPQAYLNEHEIYDPVACVEGALSQGWPRERVHPTIGLWGGGLRGVISAEHYLDRLSVAGTVGFSIYVAESVPADQWPAFAGSSGDAPAPPPEPGDPPAPPPPTTPCTDACAEGSKQCVDGDVYQDCGDHDGDGCTEWSSPYSCGTSFPGTVCRDGWCVGPEAAGSCDICTNGGKRCLDGDVYQDCGDYDGDGCTEWSAPYSCGTSFPGTFCRDGWCVGS